MALKRKIAGGLLAVVGFMLSPLSWWNDLFVNVPLALAFAWTVSSLCGRDSRSRVFEVSLVVGYWLTNVLGFVLMHKGAQKLTSSEPRPFSRSELLKNLGISLAYTVLVIALIKLGILKPIQNYFPK